MMKRVLSIQNLHKTFNFINGFVNEDMHPIDLYERTLGGMWESFKDDRANIMKTFDYSRNLGDEFFREHLSELYFEKFGRKVPIDSFFVQNGVRDLMMFLTTVFLKHDHTEKFIVVENPSFYLICGCFEQSGYNVLRCEKDEYGICLDSLEEIIEEYDVSAVYTIPFFHNPTGTCIPEERQLELIQMSQEHDFFILSDEVYSLLNYSVENDFRPMCYLDDCKNGGSVFSVSSVSKILSPGIRLGWAQVNENSDLLKIFEVDSGWAYSSGSGCQFLATMVGKSMESGDFDRHLENINHTYGERMDTLCSILSRNDKIKFTNPRGGYFLWTGGYEDEEIVEGIVNECAERGVVLWKYCEDLGEGRMGVNSLPNIRMSIGFMSLEEIIEGAEIFVDVVDQFL